MAYTFKDDGSALTFYREYNKEVGTGDRTLVGNWVEERALRDVAETGRYKLWANPDQDPRAMQTTFTKQTPRPDNCDTFRRVFAHSEVRATARPTVGEPFPRARVSRRRAHPTRPSRSTPHRRRCAQRALMSTQATRGAQSASPPAPCDTLPDASCAAAGTRSPRLARASG